MITVNKDTLQAFADAAFFCYDETNTPVWQNEDKTSHLYLTHVDGKVVFSFAGTEDFQEWLVDFDAFGLHPHPVLGYIHVGFWNNIQGALDYMVQFLKDNPQTEWYLTGHSKGGGEDTLAGAGMKLRGYAPTAIFSYEPPKVGMDKLAEFMADVPRYYTRTYNKHGTDEVTAVPMGFGWYHYGTCVRLRVPDDFDIVAKHKKQGVLAGLAALQSYP
jgi:triacylglycerol lipase